MSLLFPPESMNSNNSPRWAPPHLSSSASFLIRAPISSDDVSVTSSSASASELEELDEEREPELDDAGSATDGPAPETRPPLVPVARLTNDETETEEEEEEEVFDQVDGDGFVVRVRMSSDDEADGGGENPSFGVNFDAAEYSESSGEVSFDEVDGDGFSTGSRVHSRVGSRSSTPRPSTSIVLDEGDNEKDEILGGGSRERGSLDEEEEAFNGVEGNAAGFEKDEVLDENSNAEKGEILSGSLNLSGNLGKDGSGVDVGDEKDEIMGGGLEERSALVEGEEFNVVEAEVTRNAAAFERDGIFDGNSNVGKDNILTGNLKMTEKDEALFENSNAEKDESLTGNLNLSGDLGKVGGDDVVDEKGEILGSAPAEIEAKSSAIEMEADANEEESEGIDNAAADSNQDHELDEEDDTVSAAFEKSESKADEGVIGGSSSLVDSDIAKTFVEEEKTVTKLEESSIGSDAIPKHAENDDLFEVSSKTSDFEKEIEETHAAEDVEIMDEKGAVEGEGGHISGEQMATEAVVKDEEEGVALARAARLVRALASSSDGNNTSSMSDALRMLHTEDPTGSDSSVRPRPLKPARSLQSRPIVLTSSSLAVASEPDDATTDDAATEEEKKSREKVELIRVKFLRVLHRLGLSPEDGMANSVLNQLARIEDSKYWLFGYDNEPAGMKALMLEREEKDKLDFYCNILVIGKAGVGKSATINSIFEEEKALTNAFKSETTSVRKIEGAVDGIKIRVLDTPGLKPSILDQASNRKILSSVKKYMKRYPPDVVLYMDRLDTQTRDSNDLPLLKSITSTLGSSIWSSVAIALTHAAAAPPEGPNGLPLSYEQYVNLRSRVVQQSIGQAAGDMRFMNRVVLVENHPSCRRNRDGQRVLPNGSRWVSELLLWCCSSKILSEAQSLPQVQDLSVQIKPRFRSPPIQFFLSSVLESKPHPKLSYHLGGIDDSDIDLGYYSDEDEEDEYDQLPPFRSLTKSQIARLSKEHKRAYFEEYDYRVRLLQKKQWKEEIKRVKELKKRGEDGQAGPADGGVPEDFDDSPQNVQVPLPDTTLQLSFDCDNPAYLYRFLEPNSQFHTGYMLDANGWDHDYGYEGVTLEKALAIAARYPAAVSIRLRKDKKDFSIHLDSSASARHGESGSSLASFGMQTIGNQMAYFLEGERMFWNLKKKNKTTAGLSLTVLGDTVATGQKLADQFSIGKRVNVSVCTGRVRVKGDVAYGANLEATLMKKDYPTGQALAALGLSLVRHHGALTYGGTLQSEVPIGRNSKMAIRFGMNNGKSGQITVRTSCSEQHEIALVGLIPLAIYIFRRILYGESSLGEHNFQFY